MSKPDFISLMSELCSDLPADESTPCKIQYFDDCACIIDQQNKIWVKLTPNGSKVAFKIFLIIFRQRTSEKKRKKK